MVKNYSELNVGVKVLFWSSCLIFIGSFFLPAIGSIGDGVLGWEAAWYCAKTFPDLFSSKVLEALYYSFFTLCNLAMIVSPILLFKWPRTPGKEGKYMPVIMLVASGYVVQWGILDIWYKGVNYDLGIGYFLWVISFFLMSLVWFKVKNQIGYKLIEERHE